MAADKTLSQGCLFGFHLSLLKVIKHNRALGAEGYDQINYLRTSYLSAPFTFDFSGFN